MMKKLLISLVFICSALMIQAQSATVIHNAPQLAAITLNGTGTGTVTFPVAIGEYDLSFQLIPALAGAGDSLHFSFVVYQSNSASADVWTIEQASVTVSSTTDADAIYEISDSKGLRYKAICTGIGTDTSTVTPYYVYKKHANE